MLLDKSKIEAFKYLSEKDIMEVIDEVALKCSTRPHSIYDIDDLKQYVSILCWQKLPDFNVNKRKTDTAKQALMNWLSRIAYNRLINLHRDMLGAGSKKFKKDTDFSQQQRKALLEPISLSACDEIDKLSYEINIIDDNKILYITTKLTLEYIDVLDSILSGERVPSQYKNKLFNEIRRILLELEELSAKTN